MPESSLRARAIEDGQVIVWLGDLNSLLLIDVKGLLAGQRGRAGRARSGHQGELGTTKAPRRG